MHLSKPLEKVMGETKLKLNVKRTMLVGLAFMAITMFWQVYDNLMPLMLREMGFGETLRGLIMAADNVIALIMLPFMGLWSDNLKGKIKDKFGRRIPFIVVGSILAAFFFLLVNFSFNMAVKSAEVNSGWLAIMLVTTAFLLICMCLYRTPAVALMPDITPKPIRSQGNTVINIMGTVGGVIPTVLMMFKVFLTTETIETGNTITVWDSASGAYVEKAETVVRLVGNNWLLVGVTAALMVIATIVLVLKVNENKFVEEKKKLLIENGIVEDEEESDGEKISIKEGYKLLNKEQKKSLIFILLSVALWYFAYNGVTSHFSAFALDVLKMESFSMALIVAQAAAFIFFVPASKIGEKIGRKKTVMIGVGMMIAGFGLGAILLYSIKDIDLLKYIMYPVFVLVGAGWATINVHSFVMSVEMATERTTGVFTGLYYSFSMGAQILTPILAGACMEFIDSRSLLIYACIFCILAFITMSFVKHGNAKTLENKSDALNTNE